MSAVAGNVIYYVGLCVLTPAVMAALLRVPQLLRRLPRRAAPPPPVGPPIEKLARDLRRLHGQLDAADTPGGAARGRRRPALRAAYVDALTLACRELEVEPPRRTHAGDASPAEVLRVEALLHQRGLDVRRAA